MIRDSRVTKVLSRLIGEDSATVPAAALVPREIIADILDADDGGKHIYDGSAYVRPVGRGTILEDFTYADGPSGVDLGDWVESILGENWTGHLRITMEVVLDSN